MDRITDKHLAGLLARLNRLAGTPLEYCTKQADGTHHHQCGPLPHRPRLQWLPVVQTATDGGGVRTVVGSGFVPKRVVYELTYAYLRGLEDGMERAQ